MLAYGYFFDGHPNTSKAADKFNKQNKKAAQSVKE